MTVQLKPCPFCGGPAEIQPWSMDNGKESFSEESAGCPRCDIFAIGFGDTLKESREDAIRKWNRRVSE